jgi:hypothetical protein
VSNTADFLFCPLDRGTGQWIQWTEKKISRSTSPAPALLYHQSTQTRPPTHPTGHFTVEESSGNIRYLPTRTVRRLVAQPAPPRAPATPATQQPAHHPPPPPTNNTENELVNLGFIDEDEEYDDGENYIVVDTI